MFDNMIWKEDRMLLDDLVFRLEHFKRDDWDLGDHCFRLYKVKGLLDEYQEFFSMKPYFQAKNIIELGMWDGASLALWCELFYPSKIIGVDRLQRSNSAYFERYLRTRGLQDKVRCFWGVSQEDTYSLERIYRANFSEPLDLVIDDGSHLYQSTKLSFEFLFPLLRPGGLYIIEDWAWSHWPEFHYYPLFMESADLTSLNTEIMEMIGSCRVGKFARLHVYHGFVVVERGDQELTQGKPFTIDSKICRRPADAYPGTTNGKLQKHKDSQNQQNNLKRLTHNEVSYDDEWYRAIVKSIHDPNYEGVILPSFPEEDLQVATVGAAGINALKPAYLFYHQVRSYAEQLDVPIEQSTKILDFGCGWGRHLRFFWKDVSPKSLYGADIDPKFIEVCEQCFPIGNFTVCDIKPPLSYQDHFFDIIYAFSVFSHLSEESHRNWIAELARVLRPGGLLIASTQSRNFIDYCASFRNQTNFEHPWYQKLSTLFPDETSVGQAKTAYHSGKLIYFPTGGGSLRDPSFYGEAIVPPDYVNNVWGNYFVVSDFYDPEVLGAQTLIVGKRK